MLFRSSNIFFSDEDKFKQETRNRVEKPARGLHGTLTAAHRASWGCEVDEDCAYATLNYFRSRIQRTTVSFISALKFKNQAHDCQKVSTNGENFCDAAADRVMIMVLDKYNEKVANPNPSINFITSLPDDPARQEEAHQLLRALAVQVRPVMKRHGFEVTSLEEVCNYFETISL